MKKQTKLNKNLAIIVVNKKFLINGNFLINYLKNIINK
jgi:hypothetical protein